MMSDLYMGNPQTLALIDDLRKMPAETTWLEFKKNNADPQIIGRLISALSNAARLADEPFAYVVWGVRNADHAAVGTTFEPSEQKQKGQPLEFWLSQRLQPSIAFSFESLDYQDARLVLLRIPATSGAPVEFDRTAYVRIGSATPRLSDHPERLRGLWKKLQSSTWEHGLAKQFLNDDDVLDRLDYARYFELTEQSLPENRNGIFDWLVADHLVQKDAGGRWSITNLGAILFAKRLDDFSVSIARKGIRFVAYDGNSRMSTMRNRKDFQTGYAASLNDLTGYLDDMLPRNEKIVGAFRKEHRPYPMVAIRELIANALIHQDMTITGAGPLVELFENRLEITNPGLSLVSPDRLLDLPPRTRNGTLASLMRRMRLCEEHGTGIDKVLIAVEMNHLPSPEFRSEGDAMHVKLFAPRRFVDMAMDERVRACFQHASLKYINGERMRNSTLCERFGLAAKNAPQASSVIRRALDAGLIKLADPGHPRTGYIPFWA